MLTVFSIVFTLVIGYIVLQIIKFIKWYMHLCKLCRHPNVVPVGPAHWFWGNLKEMSNIEEFQAKAQRVVNENEAKILSMWIMFFNVQFAMVHPETVKVILKSSEPKPKGFAEPYSGLVPWLGDGLVLSDGPKWERNRKLLTPAFHFNVLRPYVIIFNEVANTFLERILKLGENGASVEVEKPLGDATLDAVLRCALSLETGIQAEGERHPYAKAINRLNMLIILKYLKPWCCFDFIYKMYAEGKEFYSLVNYIHTYVDSLVKQRRQELHNDPSLKEKKRRDFLDMLLSAKDDNGDGLTDEEIRDEVNTFLGGGHDTTSSTATWAIYSLCIHQDEQEKVFKEVRRVLGVKENSEWEDIQHMPILTMFIKESLRMNSTFTGVQRKLTKDTEIDGVTFPKGMSIPIMFAALNKHSAVWDNPEKFLPERFSESATERDPYSFVPFSAGPRSCIGQVFAMNELKVILSKILNKYRIVLDEDHVVEQSIQFSLKTKNGLKIRLEPRS